MLLGLEIEIWRVLLLLILVPTASVAILNVLFRKRGGIGAGWGGTIFVLMAAVVAVVSIFDKVRL